MGTTNSIRGTERDKEFSKMVLGISFEDTSRVQEEKRGTVSVTDPILFKRRRRQYTSKKSLGKDMAYPPQNTISSRCFEKCDPDIF